MVRRFKPDFFGKFIGGMEQVSDGPYVYFEDYDALEARIRELEAALRMCEEYFDAKGWSIERVGCAAAVHVALHGGSEKETKGK